MSLINKIKDFFYDEEEIEEEIPVKTPKKEIKKVEEIEPKKTKKINIYDIENEKKKVDSKKEEIPAKKRVEKSFNFPMDLGDDDFEPITQKTMVRRTPKETTSYRKEEPVHRTSRSLYSTSKSTKNYSSVNHEPLYHKKEEKRFKPTPMISPVYGIIDESKIKEKELQETKEFNFEKKLDYDAVRKKTFNDVLEDEKNNIFYNLDDTKEEKVITEKEYEKEVEEEYEEKPYKKDEVVITYEKVPEEEKEEEKTEMEDIEVPKIIRNKRKKINIPDEEEYEEDKKILEDENEQDLFDLIDNMYNKDQEETDEE